MSDFHTSPTVIAEAGVNHNGEVALALALVDAAKDAGATAADIVEAARYDYRKETVGMGLWVEQLQRHGAMGEDITIRNAPWDCPGMALQFSASEGNVAGFEFNEVGGCN